MSAATAVTRSPSRRGGLVGLRPLLHVSMQQDIRNIAPWVAIISVLSASSILAYAWVFPETSQRAELAATVAGNPALSLVFGPARDLLTSDGFNAWRAGQLGAFFAGLMAILIVVRNSRAQEDSGRAELIASGVVSRPTRLAVPVLMASLASVGLGVVCAVFTLLVGGGLIPTLLLAASFTVSGLMFGAVGAICAQLGSDARMANTLAVGTLGVTYVARGYLDSSAAPGWTTWLTPFGWLAAIEPAAENNAWPLLLGLMFALLAMALAFILQARRDFGQGFIATRPGPPAGGLVASLWGLALRMHRPAVLTWLVAFAVLGAVFGNLATSMASVFAANPTTAAVFAGTSAAGSVTFAFLVTLLQLVAIIAAVMGVQIVLRVYDEEAQYRVEPLLAASVRRRDYLASNVTIAFVGTAVAMLIAGIGLGLVAAASDPQVATSDVVAQTMATVPALWTLVALSVAVVGAVPSKRILAWLGVVATFGLTILGPTFRLWDWALDISPLRHVPVVTADAPEWSGLIWLTGVILVFLITGFAGYRRRDIV